MKLENILLNISSDNFKASCKLAKKEILKSPTVLDYPHKTLRQKRIKKQELEKQINSNIDLLATIKREHYSYVNRLTSAKTNSTSTRERSNYQRRVKRANINLEKLVLQLYRLNFDLISSNNNIINSINEELNKRKEKEVKEFLEEYEQQI